MRQFALLCSCIFLFVLFVSLNARAGETASWAEGVTLPASEKPVKLFNGKDLTGWEGQIEKYWSVDNGTIKGTNRDTVEASTYLFTTKKYRDFRLLLEVKQTKRPDFSTMHSGVCCLGEKFLSKGDPFSYKGALLMFCGDWGYYDLNRRNMIGPARPKGQLKHPAEKTGEWNQIEILIVGNRLRYAANGQVIFDYTDKAEMLQTSPIGLQLHQNTAKQEFHFRGLILTENPEDRLLTATESKK